MIAPHRQLRAFVWDTQAQHHENNQNKFVLRAKRRDRRTKDFKP